MFEIKYHADVVNEDIPKITLAWKKKIRIAIDQKLTVEPETFGKPLRRSLKGYRRLRVGDYRVVFRIERTTVKVLLIEHRSVVYKNVEKRV